MTAPAAPHAFGAPARFFLAAAVAVGLLVGFTTTASATTVPAAQNAVGASTVTAATLVGPWANVSPATHLESYDSQAITASATGVAANTADDVARLADDAVVVRGGTSDVPAAGEVFSGAYGQSLQEAGAYVPHGQLRATTAGQIRRGGGTVEIAPEMTRGGNLNPNHVNICLGSGSCPFGPLIANPVPKAGRIQ